MRFYVYCRVAPPGMTSQVQRNYPDNICQVWIEKFKAMDAIAIMWLEIELKLESSTLPATGISV